MSRRTSSWPAGVPCWADLSSTDPGAAASLYAEALGWHVLDQGEEYGGYAIAVVDGAAAAGIGPAQGGAPTSWTVYVASDDVEATAAAVTAHGGQLLLPPGDVGEMGRMALALDPTGAVFGVWQAGSMIGAGVVNEPGGLVWEELRSPDPAAARAFYGAVFGWSFEPVEGVTGNYAVFSLADGVPLGGIGPAGEHDAPGWLPYFAVGSTDAAVEAVAGGAGSVLHPATDTPWGRTAVVRDADGGVFAVLETSGDGPDRSG
jgi:uncharacterized protein